MINIQNSARRRQHRTVASVVRGVAIAGAVIVGVAACSDDDQSAQERYCEAGSSLEASVDSLLGLDVIAEGTNGIESALDAVEENMDELRDSAADAAADDVDALDSALSGLGDALGAAGDELTSENATAVVDAIGAVQTAAGGVYATLTDC